MCRNLLAAECPTTLARARGEERLTAGLWKALADAGVLGLAIDEQHGGSGGSLTDLGLFSVEAGRALCPTVVHSTVHAALAVDWLGTAKTKASWLPALAAGTGARHHRVVEPTRRCRCGAVAAGPSRRRRLARERDRGLRRRC